MDLPDEDELLVEMLGRVTSAAAGAGNRGASFGARFTARRLKKDVKESVLSSGLTATAAVAHAQQVIEQAGGTTHATAQLPDGAVALRGVIGVGAGGLNPAVVTITVRPQPADDGATASSVHIRAASKEGLIKQHGGRKAADRITERWSGGDPTARTG
jgi:hypothetical protein